MPITAIDNVALLETMISGQLSTETSPAAKAYYATKRDELFANPTAHSAFFENAWIPFINAFQQARRWDTYANKIAVRKTEYGRSTIMLDAHDVPGSIQNNPNDPQNELELSRFRPLYRQAAVYQNRDEFTPVTVDMQQIARLMSDGGPDSTNVSDFVSNQITMAENRDDSAEFQTLMEAISDTAVKPNIFHLQLPSLAPADNPTADDAREFAAAIRIQVLALQDFTNFYAPARNTQTVPKEQVRLIIRQSAMQRLGTLAYATSFNPEFVFALPESQIVELPDHYFDRNPGLAAQQAIIVDAGNDSAYGSVVLVDTFYGWGVSVRPIKGSENRALHHSSVLDTNPFKTFVTAGIAAGTSLMISDFDPATIALTLYGPPDVGTIASAGNVVRGQEYSTTAKVLDASGFPAGGWTIEASIAGGTSKRAVLNEYNTVLVPLDETAGTLTVTATSITDPTVTVTQTFTITGPAYEYGGGGQIILTTPTLTFTAGTGQLVYTGVPTGADLYGSTDGGVTYTKLTASPFHVASGATLHVQERAASGYVFPDGTQVRVFGPYTAT